MKKLEFIQDLIDYLEEIKTEEGNLPIFIQLEALSGRTIDDFIYVDSIDKIRNSLESNIKIENLTKSTEKVTIIF